MPEEIKVHCSHTELVDVVKLIEHPNNPNKHDERQVNLLARIIKAQGWRNPITVSKRSGYIVSGHGRLAAAKVLNQEKVPVDYQDFENDADGDGVCESDEIFGCDDELACNFDEESTENDGSCIYEPVEDALPPLTGEYAFRSKADALALSKKLNKNLNYPTNKDENKK